MSERYLDSQIIFDGLLSGDLSPERAAVLFREKIDGARYYLPESLGATLRNPQYRETIDLECPAAHVLDLYWLVFGPYHSVCAFCPYDVPIVAIFLEAKLHESLNEFSDDDLESIARVTYGKPLHAEVRK